MAALAAIGLAPTPASACITFAPFEFEDIRQADAVFVGSVERYEIVEYEDEGGVARDYGLITVDVKRTIKGKVPDTVQLYWGNSTFALPDRLQAANPSIFAAVRAESAGLPLRGPSATIFPSHRPELLQLLQAPCSGGFILPYAEDIDRDIRAILRGESIATEDFGKPEPSARPRESSGPPLQLRETKAIRRREGWGWEIIAATCAAFAGAVLVWRRTRRVVIPGS